MKDYSDFFRLPGLVSARIRKLPVSDHYFKNGVHYIVHEKVEDKRECAFPVHHPVSYHHDNKYAHFNSRSSHEIAYKLRISFLSGAFHSRVNDPGYNNED